MTSARALDYILALDAVFGEVIGASAAGARYLDFCVTNRGGAPLPKEGLYRFSTKFGGNVAHETHGPCVAER